MIDLKVENVAAYLKETFGPGAELTGIGSIGDLDQQGMKQFGYGKPLLIHYTLDGNQQQAVFSAMRGDNFGHQYYWDRAAILMFQYDAGGRLEKHVKPLGLGYINKDEGMIPVKEPMEFFILNEKLEGYDYFLDLERIRKGELRNSDIELAKEFARWLGRIHSEKHDDPSLYYRRIRNLIGASECIMGITDEAYEHPYSEFPIERFIALEKKLIEYRWKLRNYAGRLSAVHGDFHPWNVLVQENGDFAVLDRSRGEWGEPADDLSTMALNYLLFGLYDKPVLEGPFYDLYINYFDTYLEQTNDEEVLEVIAPFFVFRALVVASPAWYPDHPLAVRRGLLNFMENVLQDDVFDYKNINKYME